MTQDMADKKTNFKTVDPRPNFGLLGESLIKFWQENKIFEKSIEQRDIENSYVFYDGPPFVTGLPHYGSLLPSIAKDLIPRYQTMRGKRVRRVWGWDCHGLPIENKVEKELHIKNRRDIEKIGLDKFIPACLNYVSDTTVQWKWYIDRIGRWVDFDNAYKTMDLKYMESVMWAFKQIYDKDLIYQGTRVSMYCPRCGSPISNFEVAMDNSYVDITEDSTTYKFLLTRDSSEKLVKKLLAVESNEKISQIDLKNNEFSILAWSTTPWNKIVTTALAINPKLDYVLVKQGWEYFILAKLRLSILTDEPYEILAEFKGTDLIDLEYRPLFDIFQVPKGKKAWVIIPGDFVTAEDGTGVVTLAVYGEDDYKVMIEHNIYLLEHIDDDGKLTIDSPMFRGIDYLQANAVVDAQLATRNLIYKHEPHTHSVPTCWRCATRLYYAPQKAWFVKVSQLKEQLLKSNENINWFPKHVKYGRFQKGIESAPDWCISRNRYWATPMPVWKCDKCGELEVVGSITDIEVKSGKKVTDLHRPYIDEHTWKCSKCQGTMKREPEVLDCWLDSGSMPYAQYHYPFENKEEFEKNFPGDFVVEYIAQTRAWFYVLHVLSNAVFDSHSFKNCIVTGVIRGTDGRKMSKSYGNYPDPKKVIDTYGGDALRLYLMGSAIMAGENLNIAEEDIKEQVQRVLIILWNSYKYFVTYAVTNNWQKPQNQDEINKIKADIYQNGQLLDKWMLIKVDEFISQTGKSLDKYDIPSAVRLIRPIISDLSTWYIRQNRDRFVTGDMMALNTLYVSLYFLTLVMAPSIPFITEEIFQNLTLGQKFPQSVHLCDWPAIKNIKKDDKQVLQNMKLVQEICNLGNGLRKEKNVPIRQPLGLLIVKSNQEFSLQDEYINIIKNELNVKKVEFKKVKDGEMTIDYDFNLTTDLIDEGNARKLIRQIQEARKKANTKLTDKVVITLPDWPKSFEEEIKRKTLVLEIRKGEKLEIVG